MADKKYVLLKCDAKELFDPGLRSDLLTAMGPPVIDFVNNKSGGKLTTKAKSDDGFILNVAVASLKADDKDKPTKLTGKIAISVMTIGSTTKAFNGTSDGSVDGVGSDVAGAAKELVTSLVSDFMPKVIKTMLSL